MGKVLKLLSMGALFCIALAIGLMSGHSWNLYVAAALGLSWLGDAFLARFTPLTHNVKDPFSVGMGFFALAQIAYIIGFWQAMLGMPNLVMPVPGMPLGYTMIGGLLPVYNLAGMLFWMLILLRSDQPVLMKIMTAVYCCLLSTMAAVACAAAFTGSSIVWPLILGGALFMISDCIIAAHVFADRFPNERRYEFAVWITYLPAQILLFLGSTWLR